MATKRMFSIEVLQGEDFYQLSFGAQALYYRLCMCADDEGIVSGVRDLMRSMRCTARHLTELVEGGFVLQVLQKVVVVHWKQHNAIPPSRKKATRYPEVLAQLKLNSAEAYVCNPEYNAQTNACKQEDNTQLFCTQTVAEDRLEEKRIEKNSVDETRQEKSRPVETSREEGRQVESSTQQISDEGLSSLSSSYSSFCSFDEAQQEGYAEKALSLYQRHCQSLVPCLSLTQKVRGQLMSLKAYGVTLEELEAAFRTAQDTPFLCGEGVNGWKASMDWLTMPDNLRRVQNGVYAPRKATQKQTYSSCCDTLGEAEIEAIHKLLRS